MVSKTISIKEEAYEKLKAFKTEDKSFSDVVLELTEDKANNFENIIGEGINTNFDELKEERKREEDDDKREELLRRH